jgi:hypothetical protein
MIKFLFSIVLFGAVLLSGLLGRFTTPVSSGISANRIVKPYINVDSSTDFFDSPLSFTTLKTSTGDVQIQLVPPIPGVVFQINGQKFVSGQDGFASIQINNPGQYRLFLLPDEYHNPFQRIEFGRWLQESYDPYLDIQVPTNKVIKVGLNVYDIVGQTFTDLNGSPVDPRRIKEFSIRSTQGDFFTLHDGQPRWIPASRVARRINGLEEVKLIYSVLSVTVDGSNVVNESQQRFNAQPNGVWPISLLLYSLRLNATDALFGSIVGGSVNLEFPDGRIQNYPLDKTGIVEIHSLARGNYYMELIGIHGLSSRVPVSLSRTQEVSTKVITYLDLIVLGIVSVLIMLGLLLYGRPWLVISSLKNKRLGLTHQPKENPPAPRPTIQDGLASGQGEIDDIVSIG